MTISNFMLHRGGSPPNHRKFDVYKRELNGFTHRIGVVLATNKVQADTKVRMVYGRSLLVGETVWAVEPDDETTEDHQAA
jgi:1,2-phenylacetyl-CoA epoxidase PaaB subunit